MYLKYLNSHCHSLYIISKYVYTIIAVKCKNICVHFRDLNFLGTRLILYCLSNPDIIFVVSSHFHRTNNTNVEIWKLRRKLLSICSLNLVMILSKFRENKHRNKSRVCRDFSSHNLRVLSGYVFLLLILRKINYYN